MEQGDLDLNLGPLALLSPLMSYEHLHLCMPKTHQFSPRICASSNISNLKEMAQVSMQLPVLESWFSPLILASSSLNISRIFESLSPLHPYGHSFFTWVAEKLNGLAAATPSPSDVFSTLPLRDIPLKYRPNLQGPSGSDSCHLQEFISYRYLLAHYALDTLISVLWVS